MKTEEFQKLLSDYKVTFKMPEGYRSVIIQKSQEFECSFAIRNKSNRTEVRYSLFPYSHFSSAYAKCKSDPICLLPPPEQQFAELYYTKLSSLSGGSNFNVEPLTTNCCKKLVGADTGTYCNLVVNEQSRQPFLQIIRLQKKGSVDVVMQIFSSTPSIQADTLSPFLASLKFNN